MDYPEAYATFRASTKSAVEFADPNWTHSAITRERLRRVKDAREALQAVHQQNLGSAPARVETASVLDRLRPNDANTVAVAQNEWARVQRMLDQGRDLGQIIANADERRLAAILDQAPASDWVAQSPDIDGLVAEVESLVFDRLAALGDEDAQRALATNAKADRAAAWAGVVADSLAGRESVEPWSLLHRAAPEEAEAALAGVEAEAHVPQKLRALMALDGAEG